MFKNIMIAVDGSAYTESVLQHAVALSKQFASRIHVLTVVDVRIFEWASAIGADGFVTVVPSGVYQDESLSILDEKCVKILEKCSRLLTEEKVNFKTEKVIGSPVDQLLEKAQIADLVIMGKRGEFERWDNDELGVTVQAMSRNLSQPLLVVKKSWRPCNRILLGYDGSEHAGKALQITAQLAEGCQAQVVIISVTNDTEFGENCCREAREYLSSYAVKMDSLVISGDPGKELAHYAQTNNVDMIVIGAFGHSRIREAILGSTTEHILRFSKCPVLLAK